MSVKKDAVEFDVEVDNFEKKLAKALVDAGMKDIPFYFVGKERAHVLDPPFLVKISKCRFRVSASFRSGRRRIKFHVNPPREMLHEVVRALGA